ncbi:GAF domain-containing protein [Sphingobium sp.]|uniref:GAF domain-containing protein n=1 Tax=Sphingobium sp. TaxID=1912891 RepID=UPI000DB7D1DA|nr:GAF domain-containing protein [Sphingobium sp.]PZU69318.1 MAG: Fis family transcriptional regulator [Sphingobium sp.]
MAQTDHLHVDKVMEAVCSPRSAGLSTITASWCRSHLHYGLEPGASGRRMRVDAAALLQKREELGAMLAIATPVLDNLFRLAGRSGCGVMLGGPDGVILDRRVNDGDALDFDVVGLVEGGCWSEAQEGTNGIGTCLFEEAPVVIHRDQHFSGRNIGMSCMDAPLHDPCGRLVGVLDVSTCRRDIDALGVEMVAALVRDAARRIERDYFCRRFAPACITLIPDEGNDGMALLATDHDGLVIGANRAARQRLGLDDDTFGNPPPLDQVLRGIVDAPSFVDAERSVLRQALSRAAGNASAAARELGIARATLYRRLARVGLRR